MIALVQMGLKAGFSRRAIPLIALPGGIFFSFLLANIGGGLKGVPVNPDYESQVRPLLSKYCYRCHGPSIQQSGLRLDVRDMAHRGGYSGLPALVPGDSERSHLMQRITHADEDQRMPPQGEVPTSAEIALLRKWIVQGAVWPVSGQADNHWAYEKLVRPDLPMVKRTDWPRTPIDYFVLARLEQEGLEPSPPAEDTRLIRRLTLDLTGLPPSLEDVNSFVQDGNPQRYENLVERLLASPHFGERMARPWLDWARYADSNGYQIDRFRPMWMYRDWVIQAFNSNMAFDRFTVEQVAGDLLPKPSLAQKIATGFHRNSLFNDEDGADPAEARFNATIDRVNTTMTVWMASTMDCAQCHDHKYDPFSQKEYYQLFAFFDSASDKAAGTVDDMGPVLRFPTAEQNKKLDILVAEEEKLRLELLQQEKILETSKSTSGPAVHDQAEGEAKVEEIANRVARLRSQLEAQKKKRWELLDKVKSALVMTEAEKPPKTFVRQRGDFRRPAEAVDHGVPAVLHSFPQGEPNNRLGLARWLTSPENPLTARVTVNRLWALFFGAGLVRTLDDFGTQGDRPSHPELLRWLAVEFVEGRWNVKDTVRLIVNSSTYRQSSRVAKELLAVDPQNRLLARGSRFRMAAEQIRDNALAISGLLDRTIGGPSVFPPIPAGMWSDLTVKGLPLDKYIESEGQNRYRRGIYTFWRRSAPYLTFSLFDAPSRKLCTVGRVRTTTPLQALATLNDPSFLEASIALALRMLSHDGGRRDRLSYGFQLCVTRPPHELELNRLEALLDQQEELIRERPQALESLTEKVRTMDVKKTPDPAKLGAWSTAASVLLNLDETITRN